MTLEKDSFPVTGLRSISAAVGLPDGGVVLSDQKSGKVVRFNREGVEVGAWNVSQPGPVAVDAFQQIWVAAEDHLARIRGEEVRSMVELEAFASPRDIDAAATGTVWILDRKGSRVARLQPGTNQLEPFWEGDARLSSIAWDGLRLLGLDKKNGRVLELLKDGQIREVAGSTFQKATELVSDHRGRFAVLDERDHSITLYGAQGRLLGRFGFEGNGPSRPSSLLMYPDGGFGLPDSEAGRVHNYR